MAMVCALMLVGDSCRPMLMHMRMRVHVCPKHAGFLDFRLHVAVSSAGVCALVNRSAGSAAEFRACARTARQWHCLTAAAHAYGQISVDCRRSGAADQRSSESSLSELRVRTCLDAERLFAHLQASVGTKTIGIDTCTAHPPSPVEHTRARMTVISRAPTSCVESVTLAACLL